MDINEHLQAIELERYNPVLSQLYGSSAKTLQYQKERYAAALRSSEQQYPRRGDVEIFSAPGRTEIGGNHTDHQHGCVLAAAVDLDIIGVVGYHDEGIIRIKSEGYDAFSVSLNDLSADGHPRDSAAIVRGIAARFAETGVSIGGFDLYASSNVLSGSGISSSAAFETLIGTIIDCHYNNGRAGAVEIAKIGQFAENVYFGKNCGLMDQMVSSVGGLVSIDFESTENPVINSFAFDFEEHGYCLCITDTGGSHADLTADYSAIRSEMESVAAYFDKEYLRQVDEEDFRRTLPELRSKCSDRAVLRALHFFEENLRAIDEADALRTGNVDLFLSLARKSGRSSGQLLQNLYSCNKPCEQAIPLALSISERLLDGRGAVRVHGGGFAGTIQAFVPLDIAQHYIDGMERIFGSGSCMRLRIRPVGGTKITTEV